MTEETKTEQETEGSAVATEHSHEHDHDHEHGHDHGGIEPISISLDLLSEQSKKEVEEQTGKPVKDIPYQIAGREGLKNSRTELKFEVGAEDFGAEVTRYYEKLRKEIVLPGFRKGKAPIKLIRIRMGDEADKDAMTETATNVLRQEVIKEKFELISDPKIVKWTIEEGKPLQFSVVIETEPKVELKEYKGLTVSVENREATDEQVETEIARIRADFATWESAPAGHKLAEGDAPVLDITVTGDKGQELKHLRKENWLAHYYKSQLPEELTAKLEGLSAGESVEVAVKNTRETRKGETLETSDTYKALIRDIKIKKMPEVNDDFAKDVGDHESLQAMREAIRKNLAEGEESRQRGEALAKLAQAMIEKNPFEIPLTLVQGERYRAIMRDNQELQRMGLNLDQVISNPQQYLHTQFHAAEFRIKYAYVLAEVAKVEKLEVTEEELEKEIAAMAEKSGRKPLAIRAKLEAEKRLDSLKNQLLDRKTADFLLANNTVEKVAAKPAEAESEKKE
ncbi:trigger factor [Candidatus Sumerlaeota bacterium]|nr:trigger factor [Candidatus Sumerlaeota bacterium]